MTGRVWLNSVNPQKVQIVEIVLEFIDRLDFPRFTAEQFSVGKTVLRSNPMRPIFLEDIVHD